MAPCLHALLFTPDLEKYVYGALLKTSIENGQLLIPLEKLPDFTIFFQKRRDKECLRGHIGDDFFTLQYFCNRNNAVSYCCLLYRKRYGELHFLVQNFTAKIHLVTYTGARHPQSHYILLIGSSIWKPFP